MPLPKITWSGEATTGHAITTVSATSSNQRKSNVPSTPSRAAIRPVSRSDFMRSTSTWHSGSPKRQLYSISFGPSLVIINPA